MPRKTSLTWIWQRPEWPVFTWNSKALAEPLAAARHAQAELTGVARLLDASLDLNAQLEVLTLEGLATSAIEGETFDPNALRSSLARRLGLPSVRSAGRSREVDGLADVLLEATTDYALPLTLKRLCAWQAALFPAGRSGLREIVTGALRGAAPMRIVSGPLGRERVHYEAPPRSALAREMSALLRWFNQPPKGIDGILRAGVTHAWFEILHPFEDGNGRVGRALIDRALAQDEGRAIRHYSVSARLMEKRDEYYQALETLSRGGLDVTPWLVWFAGEVEAAMRASQYTVGHVVAKARFWLRHAQSPINARQRKALNRMFDAGPAGFEGGMTNRKYVNLTACSAATAQRDLAELVALGCLKVEGLGRSVRYQIVL